MISSAQKILLIVFGSICLVAGIIGIILPLLPTTPFLLLAAVCYVHSSPRLYEWLMNHKYLGPYIRHYREKKGIPRRAKIFTLILLWSTISLSVHLSEHAHAVIFLLIVAVCVSIHILKLKTL